jgi:glucose-6-phosphate 1-dehydrogenase
VASAHALNDELAQLVHEKQVYRIDHYLTKEIVGNIVLIRFTNCIFEPLWNNRFIDNVQIILSEQGGLEGRGVYYDEYGALRDVVQNHMLELLALIGMEAPQQLTGEYIRTQRARVLEKVMVVDGILGQFEGYTSEPGVAANSSTETFAALKLAIDNPRWAGVPFYVKTGKCLNKKETAIHIKFKTVDCLTKVCPSDSNYLTIKVSPDATFSLELNAKKIGTAYEVTPIKMEFCHSCVFGPLTPTAHEVLLEEVVRGEQAVSVRFDEIEYAWKVIDAAEKMALPLYSYKKGSEGPEQLNDFAKKHGLRWRT